MRNIAIYYRVSTDKQDLASQRVAVEEWIDALEPQKVPRTFQEFKDEGISGAKINRPALQQMLDCAYARKIDTIVVYRLDRLSRNAAHAIRLILNLDAIGVEFVSVSQPILNLQGDNPFRQTMLAAFAELAQLERESIAQRVVSGLKAAQKRGVKLGRPAKMNDEIELEMNRLRLKKWTVREIAAELDLSPATVSRALRKIDANKNLPLEKPLNS